VESVLRGIGVSPGIAIGPVLLFGANRGDIPRYAVSNTAAELARLNRAIEATRKDLTHLYNKTASKLGKAHADIFNAHLMLLDDVVIRDELEQRVRTERINSEQILDDLARHYADILGSVDDARFRERTADLLDVVDRILFHLLRAERPNLKQLDVPSIVVAHDLSPSDTATMDVKNTLGLAMDLGSVTSHTAILARALEVPAVVGLQRNGTSIEPGDVMIVDGSTGLVIVRPSPETMKRCQEARKLLETKRQALQQAAKAGPCQTLDGIEVPTLANIELPIEIEHSLSANAQGIGLYRTEYLFLDRDSLPSEEEQYEAYAQVARALNPLPVTLRTIDIGGDKFVSHLQISKEENPQLGWRAVRFCLARPDIFRTQLRAMLRASIHGNVEIMFPMISGVEELREVKSVLSEVQEELRRAGIPFSPDIKVGSMIEVPSAVTLTDILAGECDFFSVGTNDLIQYSLAVDRVNEKIAYLYEPAHPAVLRMIRRTANNARRAGIPCSLCGEMAGDPLYTELLLGLGVTALSMSSLALPFIRVEIAHINHREAQALAEEVLKLGTASEVKAVLRGRFAQRDGSRAYLPQIDPGDQGEAGRRG